MGNKQMYLPLYQLLNPSSKTSTRQSSLLLFLFIIYFPLFIKTTQTAQLEEDRQQQQQQIQSSTSSSSSQSVSVSSTPVPPCESKILEEIPPDPFYDATEITIEAASRLAYHLSKTKIHHKLTEIANTLARDVLKEDEGLLAVAIAAPSQSIAVVQFRDQVANVEEAHSNHTYLSAYWRELGVAWNQSDGTTSWGAPFRDCGPLQGRWLWPFSVTVVAHGQKVVTTSFIAADIDECNDALEPIFGRKHSCDRETTFCLMSDMDVSAARGKYTCICLEGFYVPNETLQGFTSQQVEAPSNNYSCIPCPGACLCDSSGECLFQDEPDSFLMETLLKAVIGAVLGACMFCCIVLGITVFQQRKCKTIATGMWTILETILLGILLLYTAVAIHFLPATTLRCLLEPWIREVGFCMCYGSIGLKLYRHLIEFRTRKAHRWVVRDLDLLRYLCAMLIAVLCYLSAFTASSVDFLEYAKLIWNVESTDGQVRTSDMCRPFKWDYVTEAGEMMILIFSLQLAYASRNANTQFRERQFLVASIIIEFITSSIFYLVRAWYLTDFSPNTLFLALFIRSQLTNTITLGLIFLPKLWYQHKQLELMQVPSLAYEVSYRLPVDAFKGHESGGHHSAASNLGNICLGDPEIGDLTISELSPEEIRVELKRLYTQLEVLKNKNIRHDNPHISKRRGGKRGHRRFSLQALSGKRQRPTPSCVDMEVTEAEASRTPEDSVCSIEGGELSNVTVSK